MKALIIAGGDGTRMQPVTQGRHKSLMNLLGLRIIERVILSAKKAGIYEFVIVIGYRGQDLKKFIGNGEKLGISVKYVENINWHKANGISVKVAKDYFKKEEQFVLLMSDHIFDYQTLEDIQRLKLKESECVLAIDRNLKSVLDIEDTTKVVVKNGRVQAINKQLENYNAFDTGMFVCSPYIFEVLKKTTKMKKNSLSDGMRILAREGKLRAFDIKGKVWADCDTYADIKFAEKKLLISLTKPSDGVVSKLFNRKISTFITKFLIHTPITPNIISFSIPVLAIFTFFILATGVYPWLLVGGLMIQFLSIVDGVDGEISRLKFMGSEWGKWVDPILDRYVDTILIAGMAYGYWNMTGNSFIFAIAMFTILADILQDYMSSKFVVLTGGKLITRDLPFKRDTRLLILAIGTIINQILFAFIIFILFTQYKVVNRFIAAKQITEKQIVANLQRL